MPICLLPGLIVASTHISMPIAYVSIVAGGFAVLSMKQRQASSNSAESSFPIGEWELVLINGDWDIYPVEQIGVSKCIDRS